MQDAKYDNHPDRGNPEGSGTDILSQPCHTLDGKATCLADFPARAYLIVNTASRCGFTPQLEGLEALWQEYRERGLQVLGFPCNQAGQAPGSAAKIGAFCEQNYGVSFPMFEKVRVNGARAHPIFAELKRQAPGLLGSQVIKWNFTKFLVNSDGRVVGRYAPATRPQTLRKEIEKLL